jgi:hypothetical protein
MMGAVGPVAMRDDEGAGRQRYRVAWGRHQAARVPGGDGARWREVGDDEDRLHDDGWRGRGQAVARAKSRVVEIKWGKERKEKGVVVS